MSVVKNTQFIKKYSTDLKLGRLLQLSFIVKTSQSIGWRKEKIKKAVEGDGIYVDEMMERIINLPDKYKLVVYLYYYKEYDSDQIAKIMYKLGSTVRIFLQKGREV